MVGAAGFEPTTPSPPVKCATRLRYAPTWMLYARFNPSAILFYLGQPHRIPFKIPAIAGKGSFLLRIDLVVNYVKL